MAIIGIDLGTSNSAASVLRGGKYQIESDNNFIHKRQADIF